MITACLRSQGEDEEFFSASDGEDLPARSADCALSRRKDPMDKLARPYNAGADAGFHCVDATIVDNEQGKLGAGLHSSLHAQVSDAPRKSRRVLTWDVFTGGEQETGDVELRGREGEGDRSQETEEAELIHKEADQRGRMNARKCSAEEKEIVENSDDCDVASFAGISVTVNQGVPDLEQSARHFFVRVSDQHGHRRETAPRAFRSVKHLPRGDGTIAVGESCRVWCEELKMPLLSDVEGVLFELLLLAAPRCVREESGGLQSTNTVGASSSSSKPVLHERPLPVNTSDYRHNARDKGAWDLGNGEPAPDKSGVERNGQADVNRPGKGRKKHSYPCVLVGAVALLLSELVGAWREMESPLFDCAGGVAGTIKLVARVIRGRSEWSQSREVATSADDNADYSSGWVETTRHPKHKGLGLSMSETVAAGEVTAWRPIEARLHGTGSGSVSPPPRTAESGRTPRAQRGLSAPACCGPRRRDTCARGRLVPGTLGISENWTLRGATATTKNGCQSSVSATAHEMAPRAVIFYSGMRLPLRWFRSSTARDMDNTLRDTLGIYDESIPSPCLYDVGSGIRVYLEPDLPSGLTLLAVSEGSGSPPVPANTASGPAVGVGHRAFADLMFRRRSRWSHLNNPHTRRRLVQPGSELHRHHRRRPLRYHGQVSELISSCLREDTRVDSSMLWRSASTGNMGASLATTRRRYRFTADTASSTREITPNFPGFSGRDFAADTAQDEKKRQRDRDLLEAERRQKAEHAKAKAVAWQLAFRVLCRGHRTLLMCAALWRWRSQAAHLKTDREREDEHRLERDQVLALVEHLREEIAPLTMSTYEGLVAISIDALETDFNNASGASGPSVGSGSTIDAAAELKYEQDKGIVERALTALQADISRWNELRVRQVQCLRKRLHEMHHIQEAAAICQGLHALPVGTVHGEAGAPPISTPSPSCLLHESSGGQGGGYVPLDLQSFNSDGEINSRLNWKARRAESEQQPSAVVQHTTRPPEEKQDGAAAAAVASVGDNMRETSCSSRSSRPTTAGATGGTERDRRGPRAEDTEGWEGIGNRYEGHDEVLEYFLARHAEMARPPLGEGTERQCSRRKIGGEAQEMTISELENRSVGNERDLRVLWALFRVFSGRPRPHRNSSPKQTPTAVLWTGAGGRTDAERLATFHHFVRRRSPAGVLVAHEAGGDHNSSSPRRISLPAFLAVCEGAGLLYPERKITFPLDSGQGAGKKEGQRRGEGYTTVGHGGDAGGDCRLGEGRTREAVVDLKMAGPDFNFFLLDPGDAAEIFAHTARRYGSADAIAQNYIRSSSPPLCAGVDRLGSRRSRSLATRRSSGGAVSRRDGRCNGPFRDNRGAGQTKNNHQQRHRRVFRQHQGHTRRHAERRDPRWPHSDMDGEEGLGFEQFVTAIDGVVELLTVGCEDVGGIGGGEQEGGQWGGSGGGLSFGGWFDPCSKGLSGTTASKGRSGVIQSSLESPLSPSRGGAGELCEPGNGGRGETGQREQKEYDGCTNERRMTMTPATARSRLVRLVQELATQDLLARDRLGKEALALLDPSMQSVIDANKETLHKVFSYYCRKPARRDGAERRTPTSLSPRTKEVNCTITAGGSFGSSGAGTVVATGGLCFEGGEAFAADLGLDARAEDLASAWVAAWSQQHSDLRYSCWTGFEWSGGSVVGCRMRHAESKVLSFAGFLDFVGRCALRFTPTEAYSSREENRVGKAAPKARHKGAGNCCRDPLPGLSMLTLMDLMKA